MVDSKLRNVRNFFLFRIDEAKRSDSISSWRRRPTERQRQSAKRWRNNGNGKRRHAAPRNCPMRSIRRSLRNIVASPVPLRRVLKVKCNRSQGKPSGVSSIYGRSSAPAPAPRTGAALGPHILDSPGPDLPVLLTNGLVLPLSESWARFLGSPAGRGTGQLKTSRRRQTATAHDHSVAPRSPAQFGRIISSEGSVNFSLLWSVFERQKVST
jgi:hypothetical protein